MSVNRESTVRKIRLVSLHWLNVYSLMQVRGDKITDSRIKLELVC